MFIINSLLEQFEINTYLGITSNVINLSFISFTKFSLYIIIVLFIFYMYNVLTHPDNKLISNRWSISLEPLYSTIYNMVVSQMGLKGVMYFLFIYSLFIFILISNLLSMILYNFAINPQLVFVISLSFTIWLGVTILGFYRYKPTYFSLFVLSGTPLALLLLLVIIEGISNFSRSLSLGLRLGPNILSGHLLLTILSGLLFDFMSSSILLFIIGFILLPIVLPIVPLEFAIGILQPYVFCVLTCTYFKDPIYLH